MDLLTSFAGQAALALDNARRTEDQGRAMAELQATSAALQECVEAQQRAAAAHERLAQIVLQGGSLRDLVREIQQVLALPVHIVDATGRVLATDDEERPLHQDRLDLVLEALNDETFAAENRAHIEHGVSIAPVFAGRSPVAAVLVEGELDDQPRRILERVATTAALLMVVRRSVVETELRMRGDLLAVVVLGSGATSALSARAGLVGVDLSRPLAVLVVDGAEPRQQ